MKKLLYILLFIPIALFGQEPISYQLSSGWNMVGYTGCEITPIEEAFQDALGNGSSLEETFNIIKDVRGRMWHPALGENSLLTHLTPGEGYMMFVNGDPTSVQFSEEYCNDITYQLNSGWNMVAFTGDVDSENSFVPALDAALPDGEQTSTTFEIIKNVTGKFWTSLFSTLYNFTPGKGYMMNVYDGQETTLSFTGNSTQVFENNPGVEFTLPATDNNMSVVFSAGVLNDFVGYEIYVQTQDDEYSDYSRSSENSIINEDGSVGIAVIASEYANYGDMNLANSGDLLHFTITSPDGTLINLDLDQPITYLRNGRYLVSEPLGFSIDGNPVVLGCTDDVYLEFITTANLDDGSCATLIVEGCMDESSCSYFDQANVDNGSCIYETEQSLFNTCCLDNLVTSICPSEENCATTDIDCVNLGCMSSWADNFDVFVNEDDGSCYKMGCTEDWADNYDNVSTENDGSCYKMGCTEDWADNYDNVSTENDGSCYKMGCTEDWADNYDNISTENDGSCYKMGCTEDWADNYDELATAYNNSCSLESCTSTWADNYDSNATIDDGSCYKLGCTNLLALNYDEFVTNDDGSCDYEIVTQLSLSFDAWNISINLQQGWNMFGYACPTPIDIVEGLSNHTDKVSLVKDNGGNAYVPEFNFNGIGNLIPGFGYQIKIREAIAGFNLCADYINTVMINDLESILQELSYYSDSLLQMNNTIVSMQEENDIIYNVIDSLHADLDSIISSYTDWMPIVTGCTDVNAFNYNSTANTDDGDCTPVVVGCMDVLYTEYNEQANTDNESCETLVVEGCMDILYTEYNEQANTDNESCETLVVGGCMDILYTEYNEQANTDNESCETLAVEGCMDILYTEYNEQANTDNESCETLVVEGCIDDIASNYDSIANVDNNDCEYFDYYPILDTGFLAFLEENYPTVIQDGLLNIQATDSITSISIGDDWTNPTYNINSIDGIQYFLNLEDIYTGTSTLTSFIFSDLNIDYIYLDETNLIDVQITNSTIQQLALGFLCGDIPLLTNLNLSESSIIDLWIGGYNCQTENDFINSELSDIILPINLNQISLHGSGLQNNILQQIYNLDSLEILILDGSSETPEIIESNLDLSGLSNLTNLTSLSIYTIDSLTSLPDLSELTNLTSLSISNNQSLTSLPDLSELTNLTSLSISNNQSLTSLPDLSGLTNLSYLYLDTDSIECVVGYPSQLTIQLYWPPVCEEVTYQVGDFAEGGIVFYVDETGEHGLVAAMEDLTEGATDPYGWGFNGYEWGCFEENVNGADGQSIGTGYQNTMDIVNQGCVTENGGITAAQAALDAEINGYSDWYLPSKEELSEMYSTIGNEGLEGNIGGFQNSVYWSSSESNLTFTSAAWAVDFTDGYSYFDHKANSYRVRVIRAF